MPLASVLKQERLLPIAAAVAVLVYILEHSLLEMGKTAALLAAAALIVVIILASTRVAHHAEILARKVGDPYGTMILTLSAVAVEVLILAIMMRSTASPTLVRDTIYAAVMLDINGILGLAALLGGLHIALSTDDIYATVRKLQANGVAFMSTPDTYYEKVDQRVAGHGEPLDVLRDLSLLIDGAPGDDGILLQIFTNTVIGPIFFEIIQRKGNEGFGNGNFQALFESIELDQIRRGVIKIDA